MHVLRGLHDPATIRRRCRAILAAVDDGVSPHFRIDRSGLPALADRVAALTRSRYPDLAVPLHSRWRHFEAGGIDRPRQLDALLAGRSAAEAARARFDLTLVSVLLDAGAGPAWSYAEPGSGLTLARSEGLGVASWHGFLGGRFSADPADPLRADAARLEVIGPGALRELFQAGGANPLVGLDGRAGLLARLGTVLRGEAGSVTARPALIYDRLTDGGLRTEVSAADLLGELLRTLAPIWGGGSRIRGLPAGDVWPHRWAGAATGGGEDGGTGGYVPFHKLSQWIAYSLVEPLQRSGVRVRGIEALTALPEYRNGGLLIDGGVVVPRAAHALQRPWRPGDEFVVEWRALTVALLDELAPLVRERLDAPDLPLACILEGGTWAAGREIARERRRDGAPPLKIESDGTLF
ncbi:MAG: DUF1688 family protein [Burkholderiales bacterium]|nr:DUF1688 family protein [Burkholderiales bacterium]MDE1926415.1 DUF1688 family protein [Burkholderiales bacterium]MDE2159130.1 DUF1688 family protein [Burkholderiales bacterium]MDE2503631.1 DUF1688 family protein [Burkholderiales bacterium]